MPRSKLLLAPLVAVVARRRPHPGQFEVTAIQSEFDATILPPENAYYPAAFNVIIRDTGHFSLLFSRRVVTLIAENLEVA